MNFMKTCFNLKGLKFSPLLTTKHPEGKDVDKEVPFVEEEHLKRNGVEISGARRTQKHSVENIEDTVTRNVDGPVLVGEDDGSAGTKAQRAPLGHKDTDEEEDVKIKEKFEKFLSNPKTSSGGGGFVGSRKKHGGEEDVNGNSLSGGTGKETEDVVKIEDKFETFMKNPKTSSGGGGFSKRNNLEKRSSSTEDEKWKSPFKPGSESSQDSREGEGMSTTGGILFAAVLVAGKMMQSSKKKEREEGDCSKD